MLEYKVNHTEPLDRRTKFIVSRNDESFQYDAMQLTSQIGFHRDIGYAINGTTGNIIGGGYTHLINDGKTVLVGDSSGDFGQVHQDILKHFEDGLLRAYQAHHPTVESVDIRGGTW